MTSHEHPLLSGLGRNRIVELGAGVSGLAEGRPATVHPAEPVGDDPLQWEKDGSIVSTFTVAAGESVALVLSWTVSHAAPPDVPDLDVALAATLGFWREWVRQCTYDGPDREAVVRSLITLKA